MKKTMIFAGMLSIGYAYAQRGNVGINTASPNSTLEVKVADVNSNNDTNQGVLIPKLSKTRVAAIADGKLVKGTLVFVEGITYAGTNAKVVDINADGFYYYNGTKWAKVEGSVLPSGNANGQVLKWNGSAWIASTDDNTNIYTNDGTLASNRNVDLDGKFLNFNNGITEVKGGTGISNPLRVSSANSHGASVLLHPNDTSKQVNLTVTTEGNAVLTTANAEAYINLVKNTGNIGIGGISPTAKLDVNGDARIRTLPAGANTDQVVTADANGNLRKLPLSGIDTNIYTSNGTLSAVRTVNMNGNNLMFTGTGSVGIGTATPTAKLDVSGGIRALKGDATGNGANVGYAFNQDGDTGMFAIGGDGLSASDLILKSDAIAALTINGTTKNVGIGTATPTSKLHVEGNARITNIPAGTATDQIVTADANGNLNKRPLANVMNDFSANFIINQGTTTQSANFRISGTGQADTFQTITSGNAQGYARLNSGSSTTTGWLAFYRGGNNTEKLGHIGSNNANMFYQAEGGRHHIFATTGNVGIGTETPTAKLDVAGTGRIQTIPTGATTDQVVTADANGNLRKLPLSNIDTNTNIYTNDGTLPTNRAIDLNAKTLGLNSGVVSINSGDTWAPLRIHSTYSNGAIIALSNNNWDERVQLANMAGNFTIWSNGLTRFGIDKTNGNVAIGGNTATAKLHVQGNARVETLPAGDTTDQVVTTDANGNLRKLPISSIGGNTNIYTSNGTLSAARTVNMNGNNLMFTGTGSVGIGTATPTAKLEVIGGIRALRGDATGNGANVGYAFNQDGDTGMFAVGGDGLSASDLILKSDAIAALTINGTTKNVGVGTTTPTAKLDVAGDIRTNAVIYNSDARLKKGVNKITNATATVNNLRSVTYHWNADGKKKGGNDTLQYGFIAQEVEKVLPALVTTDSEGYKSVNYVAVVPVLVKALQEKDEEVKKLQSEMEQMKKEVEQIKQLLKK